MNRSKSNKFLPLIILLVLGMTIGFAYLRTSLSINGSANFKGNTWNIYFDNVRVVNGSVTPVQVPTISSNDKTTLSFEVNLNKPGEYYEFMVDVVNAGTIDAMIDSFSVLPELTEEQSKYIEYDIRYSNGMRINYHDLLRAQSSETLRVRVAFNTKVDDSDLPNGDTTFVPSINIDYIQATDEAEEIKQGYEVSYLLRNGVFFFTDEELLDYEVYGICDEIFNVSTSNGIEKYTRCHGSFLYKDKQLYPPGSTVELKTLGIRFGDDKLCSEISLNNYECPSIDFYDDLVEEWNYKRDHIADYGYVSLDTDRDVMNFNSVYDEWNRYGYFAVPSYQTFTMPDHSVLFSRSFD